MAEGLRKRTKTAQPHSAVQPAQEPSLTTARAVVLAGDHRALTKSFVVLQLVQLGLDRQGGDGDVEHPYDEEADKEVASMWARAYANAHLVSVIPGAANKAAKMIERVFAVLATRVAEHIVRGDSVATLTKDFDAAFAACYGAPPKPVTAPEAAPPRRRRAPAAVPVRVTRPRALVVIDSLCSEPLPPAALAGLLDLLCKERLRQCIGSKTATPPVGALLSEPCAAWREILARQGPLTQGHWLLSELRHAAGSDTEVLYESFASQFSDLLIAQFKATDFHYNDGPHMLLALRATVASITSLSAAQAMWGAFISLLQEAADLALGTADRAPFLKAALAEGSSRRNLGMVFAELVNCWGMLLLGRWPMTVLGGDSAAVLQTVSDALVGSEVVDVPAASASAFHGADDGDVAMVVTADGSGPLPVAAGVPGPRLPPAAVVGIAGAALSRLLRRLKGRPSCAGKTDSEDEGSDDSDSEDLSHSDRHGDSGSDSDLAA